MTGRHNITVGNRRIRYKFTIERNITVIKGDSATGKTTLIQMINEYCTRGEDSGITLKSDKPCAVLSSSNWELILENTHDTIVFIDEGDEFVRSEEFARKAKNSDNYYVIATRAKLQNLPYSVKEIYGIKNKSGNKYQGTKRLYSEFYPVYPDKNADIEKPDCIIVEDSHSGFEFYKAVCSAWGIECVSSNGNANIETAVVESQCEKILVIADGAAFGPFIERILDLKQIKQISIFLPESFEWLILKSDLFDDAETRTILNNPSDYIESSRYFNWEQFFTELLINKSQNTYLEYKKTKLNSAYVQEREKTEILKNSPLSIIW